MLKTYEIAPGVHLRHIKDTRFYQECMSILFLRPVTRQETAKNALMVNTLLRGCGSAPDLQAIARRTDLLYGMGVGPVVMRFGDAMAVGVSMSLLNRGGVPAEEIAFAGELLTKPVLEAGVFRHDTVESEKENLCNAIADRKSNRDAFAMDRLMHYMCRGDSYSLSRLGEPEDIRAVTAGELYRHYEKVLAQSPVEIFYVGAADPVELAAQLRPLFPGRDAKAVEKTKPLPHGELQQAEETAPVVQGRLCLGFTTDITLRHPDYEAMKLCNLVLGGGLTGKLFTVIREQLGLCYTISSDYHGSKGILTVFTGIEFDKRETAQGEILRQIGLMQAGDITETELDNAKATMFTALQGVQDSPNALLSFYTSAVLSGSETDLAAYRSRIERVTVSDVQRCAGSLRLNTLYFLKGDAHEEI